MNEESRLERYNRKVVEVIMHREDHDRLIQRHDQYHHTYLHSQLGVHGMTEELKEDWNRPSCNQ